MDINVEDSESDDDGDRLNKYSKNIRKLFSNYFWVVNYVSGGSAIIKLIRLWPCSHYQVWPKSQI